MQSPNKPIWFNKPEEEVTEIHVGNVSPHKIMVCTPCHSDTSMHYTQSVLKFQQQCIQKKIQVSFTLLKSSLVTQGRNLCVAEFLNHKDHYDYLLFIDSDIDFQSNTIFKMIGADKDIISCPYPMKTFDTDKMWRTMKETNMIKTKDDVLKSAHVFPLKIGDNELKMEHGVIKVTHAPTGCMLIKRETIEKMIKHHDIETKRYFGEDFGFCQRWGDMGGEIYIYALDNITHVGDHQYCGRFYDLLENAKPVDDS